MISKSRFFSFCLGHLLFAAAASNAWALCGEPLAWKTSGGEETANPGFFDVGGGFAQLNSATSTGQAASGFLVTIKAYPCGRWYAPKKKVSSTDVSAAAQKAKEAAQANQAQANQAFNKTLTDFVAGQTELFPLQGADWRNRVSVYYGRSPGNFDSNIRGSVNSIGIAFDIAPEFALIVGKGFYQTNSGNNGIDTRQKIIFGIEMNFNAFSVFRNLGGGPTGN
jgi:hypothetical protein